MEFEPLSAKAVTVLGCGIDGTGMLTDVIILGRFDLETDRISLLQIPRIPISGTGMSPARSTRSTAIPRGTAASRS